jgi:hypothetical protein
MKNPSTWHRPIGRIDHVLSRLKRLWHYYPEFDFQILVMQTAIYANHAESDLPLTSIDDIEDIAYPEGHNFHGIRNLEMGIDRLEKYHENEPLPPVPIQTAILSRVADYWHNHPQERLGQLVISGHHMVELDTHCAPNAISLFASPSLM